MKTRLLIFLLLASLASCKSYPQESIVFQAKDKEILEQILELYSGETETPISELMVTVGHFFLETPYVAFTLETRETEQLIINLRELDCTTFAENCLAISRTIRSGNLTFEQFASELQEIRYRDGKISGYPSRLHYFCDWIFDNNQKKLIVNVPGDLPQTSFRKEINFMSTHPDSYRQLKKDSTLVAALAAQEKLISSREMFYIPEDALAGVENHLIDGDIAGITTTIGGIVIQHVVILERVDERIHFIHASSSAEKVVLSENTLEDYLLNSQSATGIMLARPL